MFEFFINKSTKEDVDDSNFNQLYLKMIFWGLVNFRLTSSNYQSTNTYIPGKRKKYVAVRKTTEEQKIFSS